MKYLIDFLCFSAAYLIGVFTTEQTSQIFISFFCSIPILNQLKDSSDCINVRKCWLMVIWTIVINSTFFSLISWAIITYVPKIMVKGFFIGTIATTLINIKSYGINEDNITDFMGVISECIVLEKRKEAFEKISQKIEFLKTRKKKMNRPLLYFSIFAVGIAAGIAIANIKDVDINFGSGAEESQYISESDMETDISFDGIYVYNCDEECIVFEITDDKMLVYSYTEDKKIRTTYNPITFTFFSEESDGCFSDHLGNVYQYPGAECAGYINATCTDRFQIEQGLKTKHWDKDSSVGTFGQLFHFAKYNNRLEIRSSKGDVKAFMTEVESMDSKIADKIKYIDYWYGRTMQMPE